MLYSFKPVEAVMGLRSENNQLLSDEKKYGLYDELSPFGNIAKSGLTI